MGYTTWFEGHIAFNKEVSSDFALKFNEFCNTRRMCRNPDLIKAIDRNWKFHSLFDELGVDGEFYIPKDNCMGQSRDASIIDYNNPPKTQPGLWCQYCLSKKELDNKEEFILEWNGGEKFYNYIEWLHYLIQKVFSPMSYLLNGALLAIGESVDDAQYIIVNDNQIKVIQYYESKEMIFDGNTQQTNDILTKIYRSASQIFAEWDCDDEYY